jgi:hypothetical protein
MEARGRFLKTAMTHEREKESRRSSLAFLFGKELGVPSVAVYRCDNFRGLIWAVGSNSPSRLRI